VGVCGIRVGGSAEVGTHGEIAKGCEGLKDMGKICRKSIAKTEQNPGFDDVLTKQWWSVVIILFLAVLFLILGGLHGFTLATKFSDE